MLTVETMSLADLQIVLDWAATEGWNPGVDDAVAFLRADPAGFLMARMDGNPAAGLSVVKHDNGNGFLGLYICKPEYRGQGFGWTLWQAGMRYLDGLSVGLDGVVEQQSNYQRSGFDFAYRNIRFAGSPSEFFDNASNKPSEAPQTCRCITAGDLLAICQLDSAVHGLDRRTFLSNWVTDNAYRRSMVIQQGDTITGFGTIRACQEGFKVGPLITETTEDARLLLYSLIELCRAREIILDVPEPNSDAMQLAQEIGLKPVFETARMYRGIPPEYQLQRLFGVTTFELG